MPILQWSFLFSIFAFSAFASQPLENPYFEQLRSSSKLVQTLDRLNTAAQENNAPEILRRFRMAQSEGSWGSGDGIVIPGDGRFVLFDFFESQLGSAPPHCGQINDEIPNSTQLQELGFELVDAKKLRSYTRAMSAIDDWQAQYSYTIPLLAAMKQALPRIALAFVNSPEMMPSPHRDSPLQTHADRIFTIASYVHPYGAFISRPLWNRLDDCSQAGLLIHETFREIRMEREIIYPEHLVRQITARILMTPPNYVAFQNQELMVNQEWQNQLILSEFDEHTTAILLNFLHSNLSRIELSPELREMFDGIYADRYKRSPWKNEDHSVLLETMSMELYQISKLPGQCPQVVRNAEQRLFCLRAPLARALARDQILGAAYSQILGGMSDIAAAFTSIRRRTSLFSRLGQIQAAYQRPNTVTSEQRRMTQSLKNIYSDWVTTHGEVFPIYILLLDERRN